MDQSGSMGQSVPKIVNVIIPMILNKLGNQSKATLITFENSSQVYSGDADYFSKLNLYAEGGTYMGKALEQLELWNFPQKFPKNSKENSKLMPKP